MLLSKLLTMVKKPKCRADAQNNWTEIRFENIDTKTKKTTISSALNGGKYWSPV